MKTKSILGMAAVVLAFATGGREAAADHVFQLVDVMFAQAPVVPEPSSLVLGGIAAAAGLGLWAWRRRAASRVG
jgi:hypothetical protein